jgi:sigma-B regulation protein RsbU (phosphoserine phosphatase)
VQAGLIPTHPPELDGLDVAGMVLSSEEVSGDYYDFMPFDEKRLGVAVCDVAGHGVPAAITMACMQMTLRGEAKPERTPAEVMERLNEQVSGWLANGRFVSLFYGVYQVPDGMLTYCNAGLDPPLLFRREGYVDRLQRGGTVLGVQRGQSYRDGVLKLFPDELVLIHTDGIVEQRDARGEQFGQARLVELVQRHLGEPLDRLRERIFNAVLEFGASAGRDDMTVVLLRLCAEGPRTRLELSGPSHA